MHASEIGLHAASDQAIIEIARAECRTIVTADLDYPRLLALSGVDEPSLILFRGGEWSDSDILDRMAQLLATASDLAHSMVVIDRQRIRRRKLPVGK